MIDDILTLEADNQNNWYWYIDASFIAHSDIKSHAQSIFTLGKGYISGSSTNQKINLRSTTESELIAMDDKIAKVIWSKRFIKCQGFKINLNIIYQDNTSTLKLMNNRKLSSGKRTRYLNIQLFYITDLIERNECYSKYYSTEDIIADYMSKPLIGAQYKRLRKQILNN